MLTYIKEIEVVSWKITPTWKVLPTFSRNYIFFFKLHRDGFKGHEYWFCNVTLKAYEFVIYVAIIIKNDS